MPGTATIVRADTTADGQVAIKFLVQEDDQPGVYLKVFVSGTADQPTIEQAIRDTAKLATGPARPPAMDVIGQMMTGAPLTL